MRYEIQIMTPTQIKMFSASNVDRLIFFLIKNNVEVLRSSKNKFIYKIDSDEKVLGKISLSKYIGKVNF